MRRDLRATLDLLRHHSGLRVDVDVDERKGWLDSVFTVTIEGDEDDVLQAVEALRAWGRMR